MITTLDSVVRRCGCPSCSGSRVVSEVLEAQASAKPLRMFDKDSVSSFCTVRVQGQPGQNKHNNRVSVLEVTIHTHGLRWMFNLIQTLKLRLRSALHTFKP